MTPSTVAGDSVTLHGAAPARPGKHGPGASTAGVSDGRVVARDARRPRWWGELLVIAWLAWVYDMITNLAPAREALALAHGRSILSFEQSLHLDPELALNRWLTGHQTFGAISSYYYDNAHFLVTLGLLGWLWWKGGAIYRPLRNSLLAINLLGLLVFWRYPVAPPRMLVSRGFSDVVASSHTIGSWHTGSLAADANQFGAMPSLHIAWAVWCTLVLWRLSRRAWVRALAVLYPCLTTFAVLATGNHYLLDVLAGLATFALAVALVRLATLRPYRMSQSCY
ncbi:MAG TPA: phosphatase PAP2 family protein [Solirubrobacteraceae bacterium]